MDTFLMRSRPGAFQGLGYLPFLCGLAALYYVAAKLGISTSLPPEGIVAVWPPNAIVLAALLLLKRKAWWAALLTVVATEVAADVPAYPLWAAIGYGLVNFSEAAIAATLLLHVRKSAQPLIGTRDFVTFLVCGPGVASATAGLLGAAVYKLGSPDLDYFHYWRIFWFGDALGLLIIGTTLLAWGRRPIWREREVLTLLVEGGALGIGLMAVAWWVFFASEGSPRVYLLFPFLIWAALRFGVHGASAAITLTSAAAVGSALSGVGPFATLGNVDNVFALQILIAVCALTAFFLAFAAEDQVRSAWALAEEARHRLIAERKAQRSNDQLRAFNQQLDSVVETRTRELRQANGRNEILFRELQHRVKNNLQLVAGLLYVHRANLSDPLSQAKLDDVQRQISAIAATYDILHQTEDTDVVDFTRVAEALCRTISASLGERAQLSFEGGGPTPVPSDSAVVLSLAVNELITNSVQHCAAASTLEVTVTCRRDRDRILLSVQDNGPGMPPGFQFAEAQGFGLKMIYSLVQEAHGEVCLRRVTQGTLAEISVPAAVIDNASRPDHPSCQSI